MAVNVIALDVPPRLTTVTFFAPVVAGEFTTMVVLVFDVGVTSVALNKTFAFSMFVPVMVIGDPADACVGLIKSYNGVYVKCRRRLCGILQDSSL